MSSVRLVASSNQSGTYFNGALNNGVGATFTYATGALTIDSVAVLLNDMVLLAGQTSGYQNGIYQCTQQGATGVSAVLTRRGDFQCIEQIRAGGFVPVSAGTAFGGSVWTVVEPLPAGVGVPVTSGANNINFSTITAAGSSLYLQVANNLSDVNSVPASLLSLGLGPTVINYTTVAITAAQFNGMYGAPKLLIADPGANKLIVVKQMALVMTFVSAAYANGGVVAAQYDSTTHGLGVLATNTEAAADFFAGVSTTFLFTGTSGNTVGILPFSTSVHKALYLSNQTGAFTTGDSTWVAHIWYSIIPTV
ncbi:MAG: hypothetical protein Q8936_14270 [Bacillota bacterium]|nr:hypothetical protein [Bacillota bacterium]